MDYDDPRLEHAAILCEEAGRTRGQLEALFLRSAGLRSEAQRARALARQIRADISRTIALHSGPG